MLPRNTHKRNTRQLQCASDIAPGGTGETQQSQARSRIHRRRQFCIPPPCTMLSPASPRTHHTASTHTHTHTFPNLAASFCGFPCPFGSSRGVSSRSTLFVISGSFVHRRSRVAKPTRAAVKGPRINQHSSGREGGCQPATRRVGGSGGGRNGQSRVVCVGSLRRPA